MKNYNAKFVVGMKFCNPANPYGTERVTVCENPYSYKKIKTGTNDPSLTKAMRRSQILRMNSGNKTTETVSNPITGTPITIADLELSTYIKITAYITDISNNQMTINVTGRYCYYNIVYEDNGKTIKANGIETSSFVIRNLTNKPERKYKFTITPYAYGYRGYPYVIYGTTTNI